MITPQIAWMEKYRPKDVNDLIFPKKEQRKIVQEWLDTETPDGNIFLFGPAGLGKTTLAELLISKIIKNRADIFRMKTRSVSEVDSLREFVLKSPMDSKKKIVYIEEADRLSAASQKELKEKYTEKYLDKTIFIITTNHPHEIDKELLTRFTYKFNFASLDPDEVTNRLKFILDKESCEYNDKELKNWIVDNPHFGCRDYINILQVTSKMNDGRIIFEEINMEKDVEDKSIALMIDMLRILLLAPDIKQKKLAYINPTESIIGSSWQELASTVHNNFGLNYRRILELVLESINYQPIKNIIAEYLEDINTKKYPHLTLLACMSMCVKCIMEVTI